MFPPSELRVINPYVQRAQELVNRDDITAYHCLYHAAKVGLGLGLTTPASKSYLSELLGVLEETRANLAQEDAIKIDEVASTHVTQCAQRLLDTADGDANPGILTSKLYLASVTIFEVGRDLTKDPSLKEQIAEKIKYGKWRATSIMKQIKEASLKKATPPNPEQESSSTPVSLIDLQEDIPAPNSPSGSVQHVSFDSLISPSPPQPPQPPQSHPLTTPVHSTGPAQMKTVDLDTRIAERAQKHARFAISALQYDDVETAIDNLKKALELLENNKS